jgi:threonine synthase
MPQIAHLECSRCQNQISAKKYETVCPKCAGALYVRYDMDELKKTAKRPEAGSAQSMWRYRDVLPEVDPVTLGEGWTPMLPSRRNPNIFLKEEATNPTGTFKARGMSMAVSMARHYGLKKLAAPSAGNAAGALAAYAAAAGIEANIFMPKDVPFANYLEGIAYGANVTLVDGLISDCARIVNERKEKEGWFDISTLKEPFRVEGKKTMGYELVEQLHWTYPDAVFYPTGGGVGLIGMWKAFEEMEQLGWIQPSNHIGHPERSAAGTQSKDLRFSSPAVNAQFNRPKMIAIQASGCAPVARAYKEGANASQMFENAATFAAGLRVPKPYGDYIILDIVRQSGGTVVDVSDETILASLLDWSRHEGLLLSPEGAAATAAYDQLIETGFLKPSDRVVIFNTGAGLKYTDMIAEAMGVARPDTTKLPERVPVGGIITPQ